MITLRSGEMSAGISTKGAWLERLEKAGADILFPKQIVDGKVRGGCHVCLPNFGPGGDSGLPQHGFGRLQEWQVERQSDDLLVLSLVGSDTYADLRSTLAYELDEQGLHMMLTAVNQGTTDLQLAPGFHPYIATDLSQVTVNHEVYELSVLAEAQVYPERITELRINDRLTLRSEGLDTWIVWSDQLGGYVCVEPTQAGFAFERPAEPSELLAPGETKTWALHILPEARS